MLNKKISELEKQIEAGGTEKRKQVEKRNQQRKPYSLEKIKEVLDYANREDLEKLKQEWPNVYQKIEELGNQPLRALIKESEPVAASESQVLIQFKSDVHSDLINRDDEKKQELEKLIRSIIGKEVRVVGVPKADWADVRQEYLNTHRIKATQEQKKSSDTLKEMFDSSIIEIKD